MKRKPAGAPIKNEADNGLKNDRGTIAMARTNDPHTATAQFFINTVNNDFLNHKSKTQQGWGYVVFGKVVAGMDVVDAISSAKTVMRGMYRDVPAENIEIRSTVVLK
jgi:peptidyl-prolyl cis-trans isomerase B (cyclophilin B)